MIPTKGEMENALIMRHGAELHKRFSKALAVLVLTLPFRLQEQE